MNREDLRLYLRLLAYVKPYRVRFAIAMAAMLAMSGLTALLAYLVKPLLDDVFFAKNLKMLYVLPWAVVLLYFFKESLAFTQHYQMQFIGQGTVARLREELFSHLQRQSLSYFDHQATGVLISRVVNDVLILQESVTRVVTSMVRDIFTIIGLTAVIFYQEWRLALLAMVVMPLAAVFIIQFGKRLRGISTETQKAMARLTTMLQEVFLGQRIVKAFAREDFEDERFARENQAYLRLRLKQAIYRGITPPVMEFLGSLGMAGIMFYGGYNVIQGNSTPGTFFSFLAALVMLYAPIKGVGQAQNSIQEGLAGATRIFAVLDLKPAIQDKPGAVTLPTLSGEIRYDGVTFGYEDRPALADINLTVGRGEVVALVGPSGAGKTTLLNLLPRFYEVSQGAITIDGRDIRDVTLASLRGQIGVVTQQTILFNDTVRFNVTYGRLEATDDEVVAALKAAYAWDFVSGLPQGLDTLIGEQGVRLSGGERQRLAIARALLKDPPILILDEATSSLDSESEREVQQALDILIKGRTTLVIAHRLSTVRNAHRLVVMADGRIVELGTHEELLRLGGLYQRLYEMQFAREEEPETIGKETVAQAVR